MVREHRAGGDHLVLLDDAPPRRVRLPALVLLEEGDRHHLLEARRLHFPLLERSEFGHLLLAFADAVGHARLGDGVVVGLVHLVEGHDLQVVWVPDRAVRVRDVHVGELVLSERRPQHLDEPERVALDGAGAVCSSSDSAVGGSGGGRSGGQRRRRRRRLRQATRHLGEWHRRRRREQLRAGEQRAL